MMWVDVAHYKACETEIAIGVRVLTNGFVVWLNGVSLFVFQEHFIAETDFFIRLSK